MRSKKRREASVLRKIARHLIIAIKKLRRAGVVYASAWMRGDGFICYRHKFWHPQMLASYLKISVCFQESWAACGRSAARWRFLMCAGLVALFE
jgi:hypothetical protein